MSLSLLIALVALAGVIVLFALFIVSVVRREAGAPRRTNRKTKKGGKSSGSRSGPSTVAGEWGDAERNRSNKDRMRFDDELPPLTMDTTNWAEIYESSADLKGQLISSHVGPPPASGGSSVYKTGFNPFFKSDASEIEVEEVVDQVQQAELMVTLGDLPAAIQMLTRHIRETEKPEPHAWLMLFDLYARTGRREQYENLAKGFRILFNAQVPSFDTQLEGGQRQLEDYPQVMTKVHRLWGLPSCKAFLDSLLYDDRGGARQGFMLAAYADILFLLDIIDELQKMQEEREERHQIELKLQGDQSV